MYAIEAGSLVEQAHRRGRLRQRHCSRLTFRTGSQKRSVFEHAIEAGSLSTGSLKRSTSNDDAGYLGSTAPRAPSFPYGLGRLAHFRMA